MGKPYTALIGFVFPYIIAFCPKIFLSDEKQREGRLPGLKLWMRLKLNLMTCFSNFINLSYHNIEILLQLDYQEI